MKSYKFLFTLHNIDDVGSIILIRLLSVLGLGQIVPDRQGDLFLINLSIPTIIH